MHECWLKNLLCSNKKNVIITLHIINLRFGYFYTCNFIFHGANDLKKFCDIIFHCTLLSLEDILHKVNVLVFHLIVYVTSWTISKLFT